MIRLGLADDEPLHIMGLATLLGAQPDMEIIWRAADGKEALARNAADPADVLLLDVQMPGLSGPATTRGSVCTVPRSVTVRPSAAARVRGSSARLHEPAADTASTAAIASTASRMLAITDPRADPSGASAPGRGS